MHARYREDENGEAGMKRRINEWLDGRRELGELPPSERREALELERLLRAAAEAESGRAGATPDLAARVMSALPAAATPSAAAPSPSRPAVRRWSRPGILPAIRRLWPARVPMAAAAPVAGLWLVIGFGLGLWLGGSDGQPVVAAESAAATVYVRFELEAPRAESVRMAGSFTGWEARHEMTPAGDGRWTITLPLEAGVHDYVFVVDGERQVLDPTAPTIADGFGGFNNRIALLPSAL